MLRVFCIVFQDIKSVSELAEFVGLRDGGDGGAVCLEFCVTAY